MNEKVDTLITGLKATAEILSVFRDSLTEQGFTRKEAVQLCGTYLQIVISGATNTPEK